MRNEFAIASILLGIFSFVQFLGIEKALLAIIFGFLAIREIKKQEMKGRNLAVMGILLGVIYISLSIWALSAVIPFIK